MQIANIFKDLTKAILWLHQDLGTLGPEIFYTSFVRIGFVSCRLTFELREHSTETCV